MPGAHKSRNTLQGANHPQFKNGRESNEARLIRVKRATALRYLVDIGNHINLFSAVVTLPGRLPNEYEKLDLGRLEEFQKAIIRSK